MSYVCSVQLQSFWQSVSNKNATFTSIFWHNPRKTNILRVREVATNGLRWRVCMSLCVHTAVKRRQEELAHLDELSYLTSVCFELGGKCCWAPTTWRAWFNRRWFGWCILRWGEKGFRKKGRSRASRDTPSSTIPRVHENNISFIYS